MLAAVQLALSLSILATFVGPLGPRTGASTGTQSADQPPVMGGGLTTDEIRSLLAHRHALVIAGEDTATALAVAEGLVDVGASVVFGCARPERAVRRVDRMNAKARAKEIQATAAVGSGSEDDALTGAAAAADEDGSGQWRAGCEARPLDLSSPAGVYRFSESFLAEGRPLHVIINCADDHHAIFHAPPDPDGTPGWERTAASNHLGPFLLTQLLLDQVVGTMRADARRSAALAKRLGARSSSSGGGASRGGGGGGGKRTPAKADAVSPDEQPLQARPYPAPLGRCVTLGLDARLGLFKPGAAPPALRGLYMRPLNYSGWRAYRCAHEANTLATLQLARMLPAVRTPTGEHIEMNVVRPSRFRWLPASLRRRLGAVDGAALTATFLASTPMRGLHGLYFSNFATEPAWRKTARRGSVGPAAAYAAKQMYAASMARVRAPPADWRSEATMVLRGKLAMQKRTARAEVRGKQQASAEGERAAGASGEGEATVDGASGRSRPRGSGGQQRQQPLELDADELFAAGGRGRGEED